MLIESALLREYGLKHAFATRVGGVSEGAFSSLNLGTGLGDREENVRENFSRFAAALGIEPASLYVQRQVHGIGVTRVTGSDEVSSIAQRDGDALMTDHAGSAVAVRTADCVPVLVASTSSRCVAAVHAGWRGAVAGVLPKAVVAMDVPVETLLVAIGPHIRTGAFEIGKDVAERMQSAARNRLVVQTIGASMYGDLAGLLIDQLESLGVTSAQIDDVGGCSFGEDAKFFSHRREQGFTGRHLSAIVAPC
ncbi:MAG: peptidoglycan editing factor PgeF [Polyangiales bacterium]